MIRRILKKRPSLRTVVATAVMTVVLVVLAYQQYKRGAFDFILRPGSAPAVVLQKNMDQPLQIVDTEAGKGAEAVAGARLAVHYIGSLSDGTPFDSSYARKVPFEFTLGAGEVIRGWDVGLLGMREGGRRRLVIPAAFGYGASGVPGTIPPNATLIFDIALVKVLTDGE